MVAGVRTATAEGQTVKEAVDMGGGALSALLYSTSITPDDVVAMSAQTVYDPAVKKWVHAITLIVRENQQGAR